MLKCECREAEGTSKKGLLRVLDRAAGNHLPEHSPEENRSQGGHPLAGIDLYDIMKIAGHTTPAMLKKYIKADSLEIVEKLPTNTTTSGNTLIRCILRYRQVLRILKLKNITNPYGFN